jgi:cyclohexadienyl dehydratase
VDVFMTDYPYSRRLLDNADWAMLSRRRAFHVLPYAYAVKPGDDAWLAQVDQFVAAHPARRPARSRRARHGLGEIVVR